MEENEKEKEEATAVADAVYAHTLGYDETIGVESARAEYPLGINEASNRYNALSESGLVDCIENDENDDDDEGLYSEIGANDNGDEGQGMAGNMSLSLTPVAEVIPHLDEDIKRETDRIGKKEECHATVESVCESEGMHLGRVKDSMQDSPTDVLQQHSKHVFIFTSPGKPVFTRHGDESHFSELFGVLRVLFAMAQRRTGDYASTDTEQGAAVVSQNNLRRVTAGNVTFYFYVEGELYYVFVLRNGVEGHRSCFRQLRQLHLQMLSLVPNVNDILTRAPSYDLRRLVSSADAALLRQLIKRNSTEESYIFRCLAAAPLNAERRRMLEDILTQHFGTRRMLAELNEGWGVSFEKKESKEDLGEGEEEQEQVANEGDHHLLSFLFFRGRVICAVGSKARSVRLHIDDALLLLNFTRFLTHAQSGECWAPICLSKFNNTGYIWCYCANLNTLVRESRGLHTPSGFTPCAQMQQCHTAGLSREENQSEEENHKETAEGGERIKQTEAHVKRPTSPVMPHDSIMEHSVSDFSGSEGVLLVHLATSQEAFTALAEQTYRFSRALASEIRDIESELLQRKDISLAMVSSHTQSRGRPRESMTAMCLEEKQLQMEKLFTVAAEKYSHEAHADTSNPEESIPISMTSASAQHSSTAFESSEDPVKKKNNTSHSDTLQQDICSEGMSGTHVFMDKDGLQWFAAVLKNRHGHEPNLVYSAPSVSMQRCPRERKRQLRIIARLRDQTSNFSQTTEPLLIVRMHNVCALVMRSIPTLVTSLVQQFCPTESDARGEAVFSPSEIVAAGARVCELFLLFLPHVTKQCMLACALRVLVRLAEHEEDLCFRQIIYS